MYLQYTSRVKSYYKTVFFFLKYRFIAKNNTSLKRGSLGAVWVEVPDLHVALVRGTDDEDLVALSAVHPATAAIASSSSAQRLHTPATAHRDKKGVDSIAHVARHMQFLD